jgi:hypothetical protein
MANNSLRFLTVLILVLRRSAISCDENPLNKTNVTSVLEGVSRKILN